MTPSQQEARERIKSAMAKLQLAQNLVQGAANNIAQVIPLSPEYDSLWELHDHVGRYWQMLSLSLIEKDVDLDSDAKAEGRS